MIRLTISVRSLVIILVLGMALFAGSDSATGAPSALTITDGIVFEAAGQNTSRDISMAGNIGGIRIYANDALNNPPISAALQFFGNGHTAFPGQAFIDSGADNNAGIIFRTAPAGQGLAERMRITADGKVGIGTFPFGPTRLVVQSFGRETGISGNSPSGTGILGTGGSAGVAGVGVSGGYAGQFTGNTIISGEIRDANEICYAHCIASDERLKRDIQALNPVLASLAALQPVEFSWRTDEFPDRRFSTERTTGLIAQDVEALLPELVTEDDAGYKGIRYERLPLLLLQGLKELNTEKLGLDEQVAALQEQNQVLTQQNAALEARLAAIEQRLHGGSSSLVAAR